MTAGDRIDVSATLEVGNVTETVTVEAHGETVETDNPTLGRLVDGEQVRDLALDGRNVVQMAMLLPGVVGRFSATRTYTDVEEELRCPKISLTTLRFAPASTCLLAWLCRKACLAGYGVDDWESHRRGWSNDSRHHRRHIERD